ncbi:DUF2637 domain-containing protein [Amycolatopsis alkalitolerans]|uniref:DUF2637 domain-containing protein n=1 Tax=Amycolatopsis alkalitolerans TaxID=2547244 RepID=UPI001358CC11|nr:DUF2637 domain-containing protein [Amycolatopsis alkalitolerans]
MLALVAFAAAALSFDTLLDLVRRSGTAGWLAPLFPVCLDAAGIGATQLWLSPAMSTRTRRSARTLALAMIFLSIVGNSLDHALVAYGWRPSWLVLVAVAAVPPAVLGAVVHLAVLATGDDRAAAAVDHSAAAEPVRSLVPRHAEVLGAMPTQAQRVRYAAEQVGSDHVPALLEWLAAHGFPVTHESARSALRRGRSNAGDEPSTQIFLPVGSDA